MTKEKYPGQHTRHLKFCWKGDGVQPPETRQMRRLSERMLRKMTKRQ